jgi:hypothetical protein
MSYWLNRLKTDGEIEDLAQELFDTSWLNFSKIIDARWLSTLDVPIASEIAMHKLFTIVRLATYQHDGIIQENMPLEHFDPDSEPIPSPIDSWARGAGNSQLRKFH